ncbi:membrane dipeptidase [Pedobacter sp. MC2016-15]|uniref:dipeptidase n=1 Tax=Pedobacter sp. MC2016-15 TaxID=2994473 RepID=UPI0022470606|nr:membrane dipeptidase [Pedobacter sp. MC2016-15]MCX2480619.1 membrane dipeptidase [Pedobacter sp. MC2016-15]
MKNIFNPSRRKFISTMALAGASTALLTHPLAAWTFEDIDPRVAGIVANTFGIDTHNHIDVPLVKSEVPGQDIKLAEAMKTSGLSAICMTFAVDYQRLDTPGQAYERFLNGLTSMDQQLKNSGIHRTLNMKEMLAAHRKHQPTVIQAVEGAHFLEGNLDRMQVAYDRGLRVLTLLHDSDASVPLGDVFTNPVRYNGLTEFGAEVIRECNRLGIVVDLSHGNEDMVSAALKIATKPVLVSHTGLNSRTVNNPMMAKMMAPRLISKQHAQFVASTGGVIGVWTHLADSALAYAENIRAMVDAVGIDHVCIGTDTKLTRSSGRPGEKGSNQQWPEQKSGFYYTVVEAMLKTGFNAEEIGKVGGGNFCRVFKEATAASKS